MIVRGSNDCLRQAIRAASICSVVVEKPYESDVEVWVMHLLTGSHPTQSKLANDTVLP
jgi:hypothetical protein